MMPRMSKKGKARKRVEEALRAGDLATIRIMLREGSDEERFLVANLIWPQVSDASSSVAEVATS